MDSDEQVRTWVSHYPSVSRCLRYIHLSILTTIHSPLFAIDFTTPIAFTTYSPFNLPAPTFLTLSSTSFCSELLDSNKRRKIPPPPTHSHTHTH